MNSLFYRLPPLKSLIAFEALVRLGTATQAAKELRCTQPAISKQIRQLEESLGSALFFKSGKRLKSTEKGLEFYQVVRSGFDDIASYSQQFREHSKNRFQITISCNLGLAHLWLLPKLISIKQHFPQYSINIILTDNPDPNQPETLSINFGKLHQSEYHLPLFEEKVVPICSKEFARINQLNKKTTPEKIMQYPLIHMDEKSAGWLNWRLWQRLNNVNPPAEDERTFLGHYETVLNFTQKGKGIALGWVQMIQPLLDEGELIAIGSHITHRKDYGYYIDISNISQPIEKDLALFIQAQVQQ